MEESRDVTVMPETPRNSALTVRDVKEQINLIQEIMRDAMKKDEHFGVIPGCGDKPALLKSGAEKLCLTFRMAPKYEVLDQESGVHREFRVICSLYHIVSGRFLGQGMGSCSTEESKYRYRTANRKCPKCGKEAIIQGKKEYGGGWLCFAKKGGCGAKFIDGDAAITSQVTGRVENEDIADVFNTVLKMAKKRALVDAVLTATAASDIFTQDIEELPQAEPEKPSVKTSATVEAPAVSGVTTTTETLTDKQRAFFWAKMKEFNIGEDVARQIIRHVRGVESTAGMTKVQMDMILEKAQIFSQERDVVDAGIPNE